MVVKMGRSLSTFLTPHSKKQVSLILSYLEHCPFVWLSAGRKDIVKLQPAKNRAAPFALHCNQRADINTLPASLSWLRVDERLTASLLFIRNNVLKIPNCLHSQLRHSSDTHTYPTRHASRGIFTVLRPSHLLLHASRWEPHMRKSSVHLLCISQRHGG